MNKIDNIHLEDNKLRIAARFRIDCQRDHALPTFIRCSTRKELLTRRQSARHTEQPTILEEGEGMHVQECTDDISTFSGLCTTRILAPVVCLFLTVVLPIFTDFSDFLGRLRPSTTTTQKTLDTLGVEESSYPGRVLHF